MIDIDGWDLDELRRLPMELEDVIIEVFRLRWMFKLGRAEIFESSPGKWHVIFPDDKVPYEVARAIVCMARCDIGYKKQRWNIGHMTLRGCATKDKPYKPRKVADLEWLKG
ncbi:hypothetical protein DRO24_01395 [Candidatus Bathyarchaeota archaeon]|nr:MAG: hypothetical protein DRO24_01395 [Candidatus Bathyarchaeota archaeon]